MRRKRLYLGLPCPHCLDTDVHSIASESRRFRPRLVGSRVYRVYECRGCGHLFVTVEHPE